MGELTRLQQKSIEQFRQAYPQYSLYNDDAVISVMKEYMEKTGKIYKGFENLAAKKNSKPNENMMTAGRGASKKTENNAFAGTFVPDKNIGLEVEITPSKDITPVQLFAFNYLKDMLKAADTNFKYQEGQDGVPGWIANAVKEAWDTEYKKSNIQKSLKATQNDVAQLQKSITGSVTKFDYVRGEEVPETFSETFLRTRGVEFSEKNVEECYEKSELLLNAKAAKTVTNRLKAELSSATVNNASNSSLVGANKAITKTFVMLGIKKQADINEVLKDIEEKHKDDPDSPIRKYGGDLRLGREKDGSYRIYRTSKGGYPEYATMEQLQVVAKEMTQRLNQAYASGLGVNFPLDASSEELEKLAQKKYEQIENDYSQSFEKAYGKKDVKELSEKYLMSQQQGIAYIDMSVNMLSMATMFVGSGALVKSAQLGVKLSHGANFAQKTLKAANWATKTAKAAQPYMMTTMVAKPVQLTQMLTKDAPITSEDLKEYGKGVGEGALWMALGMASGAVGDKTRLFLGQKGLAVAAKNSGKTIDELIALYKSGHKLPAQMGKALKLIDNTARISGTTADFVSDVVITAAVTKGIHGDDLSFTDFVMSLNGAVMGTVMHKDYLSHVSDAQKIKVIKNSLLESNPKMNDKELEKAAKQLLQIHRIAQEKHGVKKTPDTEQPDVLNSGVSNGIIDKMPGEKPISKKVPLNDKIKKLTDSSKLSKMFSNELSEEGAKFLQDIANIKNADGTPKYTTDEYSQLQKALNGPIRGIQQPLGKLLDFAKRECVDADVLKIAIDITLDASKKTFMDLTDEQLGNVKKFIKMNESMPADKKMGASLYLEVAKINNPDVKAYHTLITNTKLAPDEILELMSLKNLDAQKVSEQINAITENVAAGYSLVGKLIDDKFYVIVNDVDKNNIVTQVHNTLIDAKGNLLSRNDIEVINENGKDYRLNNCIDYRTGATTWVKLEINQKNFLLSGMTDEVRVFKDKNGKNIGSEHYSTSEVPGVYNVEKIGPDGKITVLSKGKVDPKTGHTLVEKNFESPDGTKTYYRYEDDPKGNRIIDYKITDKNGKVLMNNSQTFEVVSPNKMISSKNGKVYEIVVNGSNLNVKDMQSGKVTTIEAGKLCKDNEKLIAVLKKMPGDELISVGNKVNSLEYLDDVLGANILYAGVMNTSDNLFVALHELGHGKDAMKLLDDGNLADAISKDEKFQKIYQEECNNFIAANNFADINHVLYFILKPDINPENNLRETVAETNALLNTYDNVPEIGMRTHILQQNFPKTIAYLNGKLDDAIYQKIENQSTALDNLLRIKEKEVSAKPEKLVAEEAPVKSDADIQKEISGNVLQIRESASSHKEAAIEFLEKFGLGKDKENMCHRLKGEQSLTDKLNGYIKEGKTTTEAVGRVFDSFAARTTTEKINYKDYPELVELYKKNPDAAVRRAAEIQSQPMVDNIKQVLLAYKNGESDVKIKNVSNYMGEDGIPYFSEKQQRELLEFAAFHEIKDFDIADLTKVRGSGYTALQMNFETKDGFVFEWQYRGEEVNRFAEAEHVPYDLRENKDITGGNKDLNILYDPIKTMLQKLTKEDMKEYNQYLTAHYRYLREKELGFDVQKPVLPEKFDKRLSAENLENLADVVHALKDKKITPEKALQDYNLLIEDRFEEPALWALRKEPQIGDVVVPQKSIIKDGNIEYHTNSNPLVKAKAFSDGKPVAMNKSELIAQMSKYKNADGKPVFAKNTLKWYVDNMITENPDFKIEQFSFMLNKLDNGVFERYGEEIMKDIYSGADLNFYDLKLGKQSKYVPDEFMAEKYNLRKKLDDSPRHSRFQDNNKKLCSLIETKEQLLYAEKMADNNVNTAYISNILVEAAERPDIIAMAAKIKASSNLGGYELVKCVKQAMNNEEAANRFEFLSNSNYVKSDSVNDIHVLHFLDGDRMTPEETLLFNTAKERKLFDYKDIDIDNIKTLSSIDNIRFDAVEKSGVLNTRLVKEKSFGYFIKDHSVEMIEQYMKIINERKLLDEVNEKQLSVSEINDLVMINDENWKIVKEKGLFELGYKASDINRMMNFDKEDWKLIEKYNLFEFKPSAYDLEGLVHQSADFLPNIEKRNLLKFINDSNGQFSTDELKYFVTMSDAAWQRAENYNLFNDRSASHIAYVSEMDTKTLDFLKKNNVLYNERFSDLDLQNFAQMSQKDFDIINKYNLFRYENLKGSDLNTVVKFNEADLKMFVEKDYFKEYTVYEMKQYLELQDLFKKDNINELSIKEKKDLLNLLIKNNSSLFENRIPQIRNSKLIPHTKEDYCALLPKIVKSIGIDTRPLSDDVKSTYNTAMTNMSKKQSAFMTTNLESPDFKLSLSYPREDFIFDAKKIMSSLSKNEKAKVMDYFGFEIKELPDGTEVMRGYPINVNNGAKMAEITDISTRQVVEQLRPNVDKFSNHNKIMVEGNPELAKELNDIIKVFPEFLTTIGKKQHKTHHYTLDVHTLKVLQGVFENPNYQKLSEKDQKILQIAALLHDVTKADTGKPDKTHPVNSAFDTYLLLEKMKMSEPDKLKIYQIIKNHDWLEQYNKYTKNESGKPVEPTPAQRTQAAKKIAFELRQGNAFELASILAQADLKGVQRNDRFFAKYEQVLNDGVKEVGAFVKNLQATAIHYPQTKIPKASDLKVDNKYVIRDGKNVYVYMDKGMQLQNFGFEKNIMSDDFNVLVHGLDADKQSAVFQALGQVDSDALLSAAYINMSKENYNVFRANGYVLDVASDDIHAAYHSDFGSGMKKTLDNVIKTYLYDGERKNIRDFIPNLLKEKLSLSDEEYTKLFPEIADKSITELDITHPQVAKAYREIFNEMESRKRKGGRQYNEALIGRPKIQAGYVVTKGNERPDVPQFIKDYAAENDLPIIVFTNRFTNPVD